MVEGSFEKTITKRKDRLEEGKKYRSGKKEFRISVIPVEKEGCAISVSFCPDSCKSA